MSVQTQEAEENKTITVSPQQADQLETAIEYAKAFASPARLAIVGALAQRGDNVRDAAELRRVTSEAGEEQRSVLLDGLSIEELSAATGMKAAAMERDLRQLENAGIIAITEWAASRPGSEPQPQQVRFNLEYLKRMPQVITALHQLQAQVMPSPKGEKLDERAQVLKRFMSNGRIVALPVQQKRVMYIIEEVAKAFMTRRTYSEREVDAILKGFYPEDHCTIRRYLVDSGLLHREANVYWKAE